MMLAAGTLICSTCEASSREFRMISRTTPYKSKGQLQDLIQIYINFRGQHVFRHRWRGCLGYLFILTQIIIVYDIVSYSQLTIWLYYDYSQQSLSSSSPLIKPNTICCCIYFGCFIYSKAVSVNKLSAVLDSDCLIATFSSHIHNQNHKSSYFMTMHLLFS